MIKLQALESFTLARFNEIEMVERAGVNTIGKINKNDVFKCKKDLADYLLGANPLGRPVVKVLEIEVEYVEDKNAKVVKITEETKKALKEKTTKKKKSSKK